MAEANCHYMALRNAPIRAGAIRVPVSLLLNPGLSPSAKLIWMALRLSGDGNPPRPEPLGADTGLSRKTVLKGLAELEAAGFPEADSGGRAAAITQATRDDGVLIPAALVADRRVGVRGRILYGQLQSTPRFEPPTGRFTYVSLSRLTGNSLHTVKRALKNLAETGWLEMAQKSQRAPVRFTLRDPVSERGRAEVERIRRRLDEARFLGEALMRAYLSLLVDSEEYEDDAAPGFLVNPLTDERMELDRYYPPAVAFEFNGPQHYGATERFSEESAAKQRGRDYMKLGICAERGIRLVFIHPEDLSLEGLRRKIGSLLPLRDLTGHELPVAFLETVSRRYRRKAGRRKPAHARAGEKS